MNCFEWTTRSSDYLDGVLSGELRKEADEHLESCRECSDRHKHFKTIISSIASQPRSTLPVPIRKAPLSASLPRLDMARVRRSRWERIPWYIRTTIEGTSIVLLILLGISTGPRLRTLYEKSIERSLREYTESIESPGGSNAAGVPLTRGKSPDAAVLPNQPQSASAEEFSGEGEDESDDQASEGGDENEDVHVGNSEIWRFSLKTDSPHDFRPKVVQILTDLRISSSTPGLGGIEAPGGIQFDLLLPQSVVPGLKKQLQKIAPKPPADSTGAYMTGTFTWYKNKSRRKIPEGRTRVVIWLSQI